jgi:intraflagellar transport protein 52
VHVFSDQYIDKEANKNWFESLIDYLTDTKANILETDRDIEVAEYTTVPNVAQLSQQPRACLTESEEVPSDWTSLYQTRRNNNIISLRSDRKCVTPLFSI